MTDATSRATTIIRTITEYIGDREALKGCRVHIELVLHQFTPGSAPYRYLFCDEHIARYGGVTTDDYLLVRTAWCGQLSRMEFEIPAADVALFAYLRDSSEND